MVIPIHIFQYDPTNSCSSHSLNKTGRIKKTIAIYKKSERERKKWKKNENPEHEAIKIPILAEHDVWSETKCIFFIHFHYIACTYIHPLLIYEPVNFYVEWWYFRSFHSLFFLSLSTVENMHSLWSNHFLFNNDVW